MVMRASSQSWNHKLDVLYLCFFVVHIPVMLVVDLVPLYPRSITPPLLLDLRNWYIVTYKDRFFIDAPAFFTTYLIFEAIYDLPLSVWAVRAIIRDETLIPLHLLIWSIKTAMTTLTCMVVAMGWQGFIMEEKIALAQLYVPYLVLAAGMGLDMFLRLKRRLEESEKEKKA